MKQHYFQVTISLIILFLVACSDNQSSKLSVAEKQVSDSDSIKKKPTLTTNTPQNNSSSMSRLTKIEMDMNSDGSYETIINNIYDGKNRLINRHSSSPEYKSETTETFEFNQQNRSTTHLRVSVFTG